MRNHHPLRTGQAKGFANLIETFDFFVYSTDGLNFSFLIYRAGDRNILP